MGIRERLDIRVETTWRVYAAAARAMKDAVDRSAERGVVFALTAEKREAWAGHIMAKAARDACNKYPPLSLFQHSELN